jgi:predicted ester cyclase
METLITEKQAKSLGDCYLKARNEVNLALLDRIYSPNVIVHDPSQPQPIVSLAALKNVYKNTHTAIPDLRFSLDDIYLKEDKIVWIFTMSGAISGPCQTPMGKFPPTGRSFRFTGAAVDRITEGKIVEEWLY